jgi:cyclophilin family peptidyl-prolyl cis-trans isomerase
LELDVKFFNCTSSQVILRRTPLIAVVVLIICTPAAKAVTPTAKVRFYMNVGAVDIELYGTQSPLNVANFLSYVDDHSYDNTLIHRTRDGAIPATSDRFDQGGSFKADSFTSIVPKAAVLNEFNVANGLSNVQYTLAAAQTPNDINSATSGWFINQSNNALAFDPGKYTIMGKVTMGQSLVDAWPFMQNIPVLKGTPLETMPVFVTGTAPNQVVNEVIINRAVRIPIVPGDYDFSGSVTAADYTVWRSNFGSTTNTAADGNGNGVVDAADYVIYRKRFGATSGSGSSDLGEVSVPEPASGLLVVLGMLLVGPLERRRTRR